MTSDPLLFSSDSLDGVLQQRFRSMVADINSLDPDYLLNADVPSLCDHFVQEYRVEVPRLREEAITLDQKETRKTVSSGGQSYQELGTDFMFFVPFEGDEHLFRYKPSSFTMNPPSAKVEPNELIFTYFWPYLGHDVEEREVQKIRRRFEEDLGRVKLSLQQMTIDTRDFPQKLKSEAQRQVEFRRKKLLRDRGISVSLGIPLKRRGDAPQTYIVPTVRKKIMSLPPASTEPYIPEPALDMKEYEHILSVIQNMVLVMERSPTTFQSAGEENLRDHFLVQLNGQYEGQATGETFNAEGKTDILIRVQGKNIFIAECKFWDGPQSLTDAIDQLLGYTSWRDTKTAIVLFNRTKNFSATLKKIPATVKAHANFRREVSSQSESQLRYIFTHKDDPDRELSLTIMAFEVPREP